MQEIPVVVSILHISCTLSVPIKTQEYLSYQNSTHHKQAALATAQAAQAAAEARAEHATEGERAAKELAEELAEAQARGDGRVQQLQMVLKEHQEVYTLTTILVVCKKLIVRFSPWLLVVQKAREMLRCGD